MTHEPLPARSIDGATWDAEVLAGQPMANYMQSHWWSETRQGTHWTPLREHYDVDGTSYPVQIFARKAPFVGTLYHLPRLTGVTPATIQAITEHAAQYPKDVFGLKLETFQPRDEALMHAFEDAGWVEASSSQYEHAVAVDLTGTLDEVAARFKKRARNSYRSAERKGVTIEKVAMNDENIALMHELVGQVKERTGGYFRKPEYFERIWRVYQQAGQGYFYFARVDGDIAAGAFVIRFGRQAWYKDAGSTREHDKVFAPYAMQWAIMQDLHADGVESYELANIPDPAEWETSEIRGLYTFKTAWAREPVQYMPTYELPLNRKWRTWRKFGRYIQALYTRPTGDAWY